MKEDLMKKMLDWINNIESFAAEQIPDFAEQVVQWGIFEGLCGICMSLLGSVVLSILCIKFYTQMKVAKAKDKWAGDVWLALTMICGIGSAATFIFPLNIFIFQTIKAIAAPKLYLIDYFLK